MRRKWNTKNSVLNFGILVIVIDTFVNVYTKNDRFNIIMISKIYFEYNKCQNCNIINKIMSHLR